MSRVFPHPVLRFGSRLRRWRCGRGLRSRSPSLCRPSRYDPLLRRAILPPTRRADGGLRARSSAASTLTAFREATKRVDEKNDPKADDAARRALCRRARRAQRRQEGQRAGTSSPPRAATARRSSRSRCSASPAARERTPTATRAPSSSPRPPSSAMRSTAYDLALLYLEGQLLPQDFTRAAELMKMASDAGNPQAQYALATFYKEGRGVKMNAQEATRLLAAAARSGYTDAEVEYAHRAVQRHRREKGRALSRRIPAQGRQEEQRAGAKPPRADVRLRQGHQGRPGPGRALAHDRQGRRQQRPVSGRLRAPR